MRSVRAGDRSVVIVAVALVVAPIWVATLRALADGWLAIGDNANFLIRSRDVLTDHHPLLGTWTSASLSIGEHVDNPGPLLFDLLAIPAKLGGSGGMAVGVALVNTAAVVGIAALLHRVGGARAAFAGLLAAAGLAWSMGSELLFDPWQPHSLLLPFLLLLVLVWAMVRGFTLALPVAALVASLIVQTHLSYVLLVPAVCLWGVVWLVRARRGEVIRPAVAAAAVLVLAWVQPLWDQLFGQGNLGKLAAGAGAAVDTVGPTLGLRLVADVVAVPPSWARPSFADAAQPPPGQPPLVAGEPNLAGLPSAPVAALALIAVAVVLGLAWWAAHRWADGTGRAAVGVAAVALAASLVAVVTLPVGVLGVAPHQLRFLWPVAAFATAAVLVVLVRHRGALLAAVAVLAVLNLPPHDVAAGPAADADVIPVVGALTAQLEPVEGVGLVLYDTRGLRFAEPWTSPIMADLQARGVELVVDDEGWVGQLGPGRRYEGEAAWRLFVREGAAAREVPAGARRVALVEGLDEEEEDELAALERRLSDVDIRLDDEGRAAAEIGALPSFADGAPSAAQLLATGELSVLVREDLIDAPAGFRPVLERYAHLRYRDDRHTVAVFLARMP